ncbi:hypothetical protein [Ferrimicrobium acidiphilum]|uniref:hypothetical protein n=1 Tax=Ferrimicrobium acidiphilum TaxID=121039 RepID=UPI0023F507FE|nr:hypothetical protein [Ferrimicrobium acidiphilum]
MGDTIGFSEKGESAAVGAKTGMGVGRALREIDRAPSVDNGANSLATGVVLCVLPLLDEYKAILGWRRSYVSDATKVE